MFTVEWLPKYNIRDEIDFIGEYDYVVDAFRSIDIGPTWYFDGDGWNSDDVTRNNESGNYYIAWRNE
jgi:hypothetical protein